MQRVTVIVVCLLYVSSGNCQLYPGDECTHRGKEGTCMLLQECLPAQDGIKQGDYPTICSFERFNPVVCCAGSLASQTSTSPPSTSASVQILLERPATKADEMCKEYAKAVYRYENPPTLLIGAKPNRVNLCHQSGKPFIIGGEKADRAEFPHMAVVGFGPKEDISWWCGGSLISPRFVLTAAHCLKSRSKGYAAWVHVGDLNLKLTTDKVEPQEAAVIERIPYPDYKPSALYNDIALLKLDRDLELNEFVRPACLHTSFYINSNKTIATGWGLTDWAQSQGSDHLMKVILPIQPRDTCQTAYKALLTTAKLSNGISEESMVCAGSLEGGKDTCKGDSGGPIQLIMMEPYCMYDIIGLTSFGKTGCGAQNAPAVYTRISHYIPWIEKIVWP